MTGIAWPERLVLEATVAVRDDGIYMTQAVMSSRDCDPAVEVTSTLTGAKVVVRIGDGPTYRIDLEELASAIAIKLREVATGETDA